MGVDNDPHQNLFIWRCIMQCLVEGCDRTAKHRGYCQKHYARLKRQGKLENLPKKSGGICLAEGCDRVVTKHGGFGYCSKHYQRFKKHGDPNRADWKKLEGENFEEKLKLNSIEDENGCWIWQGAQNKSGYGSVNIGGGKTAQAHRLAFKLWCGELPDEFFVCHHCDQPLCVNPNHLFLGTNQDNIDDKMYKGRAYTGVHKGVLNAMSKLTNEQVKWIKYLCLKKGESQANVARLYEINKQTVNDIVNNKKWTHIECPEKAPRKVKRRKRKI